MQKKDNWYKNTPGYIQYACTGLTTTSLARFPNSTASWGFPHPLVSVICKKFLFIKTSKAWPHFHKTKDFFLQKFNSCDLLRLCWQPPYYFREKVSGNLKLRTIFPMTFCSIGLQKIGTFFTKAFISRNFLPVTFLQKLSLSKERTPDASISVLQYLGGM